MAKAKWNILSTRPIDEALVEEALQNQIAIDCISFIETEAIQTDAVKEKIQELSQKKITAVFTSMNAVDAVVPFLKTKPEWKVYCIGHATKKLVGDYIGEERICGTANDASALADVIAAHETTGAYFFCGDQRRNELPDKLKSFGVELTEVVVYRTLPQQKQVTKTYDGVLFFSPSAVHSFFKANTIERDVVLFAIGNTTSDAIRNYVENETVIADLPAKDELVRKMMDHFSKVQKQIN